MLMGPLTQVVGCCELEGSDMSADRVEQFLADRRRDHRHYFSAIGIGPLLGFLRDLGIAPMGGRSPLTQRGN
jgi:hypothetical protein